MIIIYGGAFNPPTKAHYLIAKMLIEKFNPDTFYFLPVGEKYNKDGMARYHDRFNMINLVSEILPNSVVSNKENEPEFRGTYYMLKEFKEIDENLYFVMGADNFDYLDNWIMASNLISEFKFIVLKRKGYDVDKLISEKYYEHKDNFTIIDIDLPISSTEFRTHKDEEILLPCVYEYIKENNLYEVNENV